MFWYTCVAEFKISLMSSTLDTTVFVNSTFLLISHTSKANFVFLIGVHNCSNSFAPMTVPEQILKSESIPVSAKLDFSLP